MRYGLLEFEKIKYHHMIKEHKYIIIEHSPYITSKYSGIYKGHDINNCEIWENYRLLSIENTYYYMIPLTYYILVPKKYSIQHAMESRSLNKILQKIIGDDTFTFNYQ